MINIATIGSGMIVHTILDSIAKTEGICCSAVYSRKEETGKALADEFNVKKVYTKLEDMFSDTGIDFIYIASPNSLHYEQAKLALEYGKNVICEKPFTSTAWEAKELIDMAKDKHLMLIEGITTMYLPNLQAIKGNISKLGKLHLVLCNFSQYSSRYNLLLEGGTPNVFNPEFSSGALMDINLYNIYLAVALFGKPDSIHYFANKYKNGIDTSGIAILKYNDFICECTGAKDTSGVNFVQIQGEKGYMYITGESSGCREVKLVTGKEEFMLASEASALQWMHEVNGWLKLIESQDYEECYRRLDTTLEVVEVLEAARRDAGIVFPADKR